MPAMLVLRQRQVDRILAVMDSGALVGIHF